MPDTPAEVLDELWTDYKANSTSSARERLILHYSPLVKFVAGRVAAGLPQNIEQADLVSYGIFGLIDAIDKFDPGRGFKFDAPLTCSCRTDRSASSIGSSRSVRQSCFERDYPTLQARARARRVSPRLARQLDLQLDAAIRRAAVGRRIVGDGSRVRVAH